MQYFMIRYLGRLARRMLRSDLAADLFDRFLDDRLLASFRRFVRSATELDHRDVDFFRLMRLLQRRELRVEHGRLHKVAGAMLHPVQEQSARALHCERRREAESTT